MAKTKNILGDVFGLSQFGVNLVSLPPGTWSSQRHWHENEEEFIYVLSGELTLATDDGEHLLKPGMCAGFKTGPDSGHCLKNLSDAPAQYLEMGTRKNDEVAWYNDIDLKVEIKNRQARYLRKDGSAA
ncbi:cupin domain-containing protein [Aestuariivirga litoralis]|uniref:cupin domain-containing protein n=1 Tax=Aestuariivirga litoralis TaxID=2650924 RepID=UPI001FEEBFA5|nr:cupin domain-containing protein [Aestuariivirga litoralis]